ncbi:hypothetical protein PE067_05250 [Paracoccus sp. DMF-8]|uniref:hypothetical protein n=1 Tax=Paracoccus sp. DMF-8 TaxID=3019445 RepID=UPI0023E7B623|nr:hypothetical protein [Paracoccus sp. DMF-8]MDF3605603.1 hypothetical protein [Paracoccus sp. DMF-8]
MQDVLIVAVPLIAALTGAIYGYRRCGARQWGWLAGGIAGVLLAAGICYVTGQGKTGGYLAGIVGTVMAMVALIMAAAILAGAMIRGTHELIARPPRLTPSGPAGAAVLGLLSIAMILISAAE